MCRGACIIRQGGFPIKSHIWQQSYSNKTCFDSFCDKADGKHNATIKHLHNMQFGNIHVLFWMHNIKVCNSWTWALYCVWVYDSFDHDDRTKLLHSQYSVNANVNTHCQELIMYVYNINTYEMYHTDSDILLCVGIL